MNGEACGGGGGNLAIGKVNNGSWSWAKQVGGQSRSTPLWHGLVYKDSNLFIMGNVYPCTSDTTKQIVIGSTTITQSNNSHYQEFLTKISTSGNWGTTIWNGGSTNAFMENIGITATSNGILLSGVFKSTSVSNKLFLGQLSTVKRR